MTVCTHGHSKSERRCDVSQAHQHAQRERDGYIGGIAYALRLLNSPPLNPGGAPINLLAAQYVLEAMLDGHADRYRSMANEEMRSYQERRDAAVERQGGER